MSATAQPPPAPAAGNQIGSPIGSPAGGQFANPSNHSTGGQSDWCAALLDPTLPAPAGLRAWNGVDPRSRLAVHRNNVVGGLVEVLAANFPVVQQLVGAAFFRAMAAAYVRQWPPRSCLLSHYGAPATALAPGAADNGFPAFIASFGPAASLPYLADLACLEAARIHACHAADAAALTAEAGAAALAAGGQAAVADLRLVCHPSLALITSGHAVVSLWAAHQADGEPDLAHIVLDTPEAALVLRQGLDVLVLPLPAALAPGLAVLLQALQRRARLGDAAAQTLAAQPDTDLAILLNLLVRHGGLCAIHLP